MAEHSTSFSIIGQKNAEEEKLLLNHLHRIGVNPQGWYGVHAHLSGLQSGDQQPKFIRIATQAFDNLTNNFDSTLYLMANFDMILISKETPIEAIDEALSNVRSLFSEDPLTEGEEGSFEDRFTTWYDLSQNSDLTALDADVKFLSEEAECKRSREEEERTSSLINQMDGEPLTARNLTIISDKLQRVQIDGLVQYQSAIIMEADMKGRLLFNEYFISMSDLQRRIAPDTNLFGNPWLFNYLTELLDKRLLSVIAARDFSVTRDAVSLNMNISTVLSREFQTFHRMLGENAKNVLIELQMVDVLSDLSTFQYAKDSLVDNGYRVILDGLNPLSLQFFDPSQLNVDFVKIAWGREFKADTTQTKVSEVREIVIRLGKDQVILGRVDSEEAIKWALSMGIQRFQGHYVDTIADAMYVKGIIGDR
jgi:EAL domain-containing protein (putative c-di-GMP-specific phosphodiesterase class I)